MNQNIKRTIVITSVITLLPMLIGMFLWNRLPEQIPTHFGLDGQPDSWSDRTFAVFFLPCIPAVIHILCILVTSIDPKGKNISPRVYNAILWINPVISLFVSSTMYSCALGYVTRVNTIICTLSGILFIVIGNYLPKCRQNYTVGIRLPWTLADEDNWNRTHRLAGPLWMAGGLIILLAGIFGISPGVVTVAVLAVMVLVPSIYSYMLYRQKQN